MLAAAPDAFRFQLPKKCIFVLGIDLSIRNINKAQQNLDKNPVSNISFQHKSLNVLYKEGHHFDYAVITFVIHEINENERISLLKEVSEIADTIIIGDYIAPGPKGFGGYLTQIIEFLAGERALSKLLKLYSQWRNSGTGKKVRSENYQYD